MVDSATRLHHLPTFQICVEITLVSCISWPTYFMYPMSSWNLSNQWRWHCKPQAATKRCQSRGHICIMMTCGTVRRVTIYLRLSDRGVSAISETSVRDCFQVAEMGVLFTNMNWICYGISPRHSSRARIARNLAEILTFIILTKYFEN